MDDSGWLSKEQRAEIAAQYGEVPSVMALAIKQLLAHAALAEEKYETLRQEALDACERNMAKDQRISDLEAQVKKYQGGAWVENARLRNVVTEQGQRIPDLTEALEELVCSGCGHRIGWTGVHDAEQSRLGRTDWKTCNHCKAARAVLGSKP